MLLTSALHLSAFLVHVVECRHQSHVQHSQCRQGDDQHKDRVEHVTVDDQVQPVVDEGRVDGACDPISAVLETTLGKLGCVVEHSENENCR